MQSRGRFLWGIALILFGGLLLAYQAGALRPLQMSFPVFLFGIPALMFLLTFVIDRRQWWALIPGCVLAGLTLLVFNGENHLIRDEYAASIFLFSIGLPFLGIFLADRRQWWALIPGGVMTVIAFMPLLGNMELSGEIVGGLFFLGLGGVFALVRLATLPNPHMAWAWWPAGILAAFGLFIVLTGTVASQIFWPIALIVLGLIILARGYWPRPHSGV